MYFSLATLNHACSAELSTLLPWLGARWQAVTAVRWMNKPGNGPGITISPEQSRLTVVTKADAACAPLLQEGPVAVREVSG